MERRGLIGLLLLSIVFSPRLPAQTNAPSAPVHEVFDTYFGLRVVDPYRWMEARPNPELLSYLNAQGERTRSVLSRLSSQRSSLLARALGLQDEVSSVSSVKRVGDKYYYLESPPGSKDRLLMVRPVAGGSARRLLDPAQFAAPGTHAAITYFQPSWDGNYVAAGVSLGGSEDATMRIIRTTTAEMLKDAITRTQYAEVAWSEDSRSVYFMRLQELARNAPPSAIYENTRVYLHKVGTDEHMDKAVFGADVNPELELPKAGFVYCAPLPGTALLWAAEYRGTIETPAVWIKSLESETAPWRQIVRHRDGAMGFASKGATFYVLTKSEAPNGRVVVFDAGNQDYSQAKQVLGQSDLILTSLFDGGIRTAQDAVYVYGRRGGNSIVLRLPYENPPRAVEISLPFSGSVFDVTADYRLPGLTFSMSSWTQAPAVFSYDPATKRSQNVGLQPPHPADFTGINVAEVEATSADGIRVPVTIIYRKDLALDGSHPALLDAYGAYGICITSVFSPAILAWLERGGIVAHAHVRGGGEKGEAWHRAGQKQNKQRTIDDFVACARYLIDHRYTSSSHLAVSGTSAGGIAVGGFITQHPDLVRAALYRVGISDLLRYETTQGGDANIPEFGSVKVEADFRSLYAISPYHHVTEGTAYPAVLLETGLNDPRVPSWQVAKMTARLQAATSSHLPVLLRVDKDAGHGIGSDRRQAAELLADEFTFLGWQLGMPGFAPQ